MGEFVALLVRVSPSRLNVPGSNPVVAIHFLSVHFNLYCVSLLAIGSPHRSIVLGDGQKYDSKGHLKNNLYRQADNFNDPCKQTFIQGDAKEENKPKH